MKKFVFISIITCFLLMTFAYANIGDVVGDIYATDIVTYINDIPVKSYNIGGKTCVAVEEVTTAISYINDLRTLFVNSFNPMFLIKDDNKTNDIKIGEVVGKIYETDIKTFIYNTQLLSYNIGGKTCIVVENLGGVDNFSDIGGKVNWNPDKRELRLEFMYDNSKSWDLQRLLRENDYLLDITDGVATLTKGENPQGEFTSRFEKDEYINADRLILPIYLNINGEDQLIGYQFKTPDIGASRGSGVWETYDSSDSFVYFYTYPVETIILGK